MSSSNTARKMKVGAYLERYAPAGRPMRIPDHDYPDLQRLQNSYNPRPRDLVT